jgi:23S rRNA pseudouridine2457 synthase
MMHRPYHYFVLNKPVGMESQFVSPFPGDLLGDLSYTFPEGTHAIGRLDKNSEGLLLLTTNKKITSLLFQSKIPHKRTYLVQVKHQMSQENLQRLCSGIDIRIQGGATYRTPPCEAKLVKYEEQKFHSKDEHKASLTTTWLSITLTEGKFHQVRKMVFAAGHRCMRLIRISIEDLELGTLLPGQVRSIEEEHFFSLLKLDTASLAPKHCLKIF